MFKFIKNKKLLFFIVFVLAVIPISTTIAAVLMQTEWPRAPGGAFLGPASTITDLVRYLYEWGIALGGIVAFIALLIAGFTYMTSVGEPGKMKEAMDRIKSAFLGLTLLLGSWLILHTINPELTTFREIKFDPGVVKQPSPLDLKGLEVAAKPCKFGIYFKETHFDGYGHIIELDTTIGRNVDVQSIIMCKPVKELPTKLTRIEDKRCAEQGNYLEGGSCMLQLFDGGFADIGCGGPEFNVIGTNSNINRVFDTEEIDCIRLIEIGQI